METNKNLKIALNNIVGQKVLKINLGENTGSIINLEFGEELKIVKKGKYEFWEGEFSLMIYCAWRLSKLESVLTSWQESNSIDGVMVRGLDGLKLKRVLSVEISNFYDLFVRFEDDIELHVFTDLSANQNLDTNWFFRDVSKNYVINNYYQLEEF